MVEGLSQVPPHELKQEVQAWLASFTPLVMVRDIQTETEVMQRLGLILDLKKRGPFLKLRLGDLGHEEWELSDTFRRAFDQLPSLEEDARRMLAVLRPGDPRGVPNLDDLQDRLGEREARQEIGADTLPQVTDSLVEIASPQQPGNAMGQLTMALAVLGFVTFHAIAMIGGMWMAFGPAALFLLAFYSIFYFAGFATLSSAFKAGAEEKITLTGRTLEVSRTLGPFSTRRDYVIAANSMPRIGMPNVVVSTRRGQIPQTAILLTDLEGKEVAIGMGMTMEMREKLRDKIASYLKMQD